MASKSLAELMEARRLELGWNKQVAAERCGIVYPTFVDYTLGKIREPPLPALRQIADGLGLTLYAVMESVYGARMLRGLRPESEPEVQ